MLLLSQNKTHNVFIIKDIFYLFKFSYEKLKRINLRFMLFKQHLFLDNFPTEIIFFKVKREWMIIFSLLLFLWQLLQFNVLQNHHTNILNVRKTFQSAEEIHLKIARLLINKDAEYSMLRKKFRRFLYLFHEDSWEKAGKKTNIT